MWVRVDARRRWRSWVVLGVLAGVSVGIACAGVAGARRTENAIPTYARAINLPDAAVLPNDPDFDEAQRAKVAALPEVEETYPFLVPYLLEVQSEEHLDAPLLPTEPQSSAVSYGILVAGRFPDPARADEIVVNENVREQFGFDLDDTLTLTQTPPDASFPFPVPAGAARLIKQDLRVVGITRADGEDINLSPSSAFYAKYESQLVGSVNEFVKLHGGDDDFVRFQAGVQRITGKPTNVERVEDLFGIRKLRRVAEVERNGLLLFALAVLLGAGVLVGQALVRAVTAGAVDISTWRPRC
jgi:hypothetical protein